MHLRTLERECHDWFGMPPTQLLDEIWLIETRRLLKGRLAKQIQNEMGFKRLSDFSRKFRAVSGMTIKQCQKSCGETAGNAPERLFTLLSQNANSKKLHSSFARVEISREFEPSLPPSAISDRHGS